MVDWLKIRLIEIVAWFLDLSKELVSALWDIFKDGVSWAFDQFLGVTITALSAVDVSGFAAYSNSWGSLPSEIINIMGLLGVGQASAIIMSAVVIRLALQLIPFTRLGS